MMTRSTIAVTILLLVAPAVTGLASDNAVRDEAVRFTREAARFTRQEQYSDALVRFERALAYRATRSPLWNAGLCHLYLGHRDLTLWFMHRYLVQEQAARESLEVQQALAAIAEEPEIIALDRRAGLANQISAAANAAVDGNATPAAPEQQVYGTSGAGGSSSDEATRWLTAYRYGTTLFDYGLDQITDGDWEEARSFFERSLAYRSLRNAAYNIGVVHLAYGRRDLAVHFYRQYVNATRQARGDAGIETALRAIEDSPPRVGSQARRNELSDQLSAAINRALGEAPGGTETRASAGASTPGP